MKKLKLLIAMMIVSPLYAADNEIYIDQSGSTANIDLEQLGNSNIIGGLNSVAGTLTALDLDGLNLTLDINQIGNSNKFLGDILGDNITGFFEFDGDSNMLPTSRTPTNSTKQLCWPSSPEMHTKPAKPWQTMFLVLLHCFAASWANSSDEMSHHNA